MPIRVFVVFAAVAVIVLSIFGFPVLKQIYRNAAYTESTMGENMRWSVQPITDEEFRPKVKFQYTVAGKLYEKEELFQGESYRNPFVAQDALTELKEKYQIVWYSPRNPDNATVEKFFPLKRAIYCGIVLALLNYLIWGVYNYAKLSMGQNSSKGKR